MLYDTLGVAVGMLSSSLPFDFIYDFLEGCEQKYDDEDSFFDYVQDHLPDSIEWIDNVGDYCM